jgi:hypothetical protein
MAVVVRGTVGFFCDTKRTSEGNPTYARRIRDDVHKSASPLTTARVSIGEGASFWRASSASNPVMFRASTTARLYSHRAVWPIVQTERSKCRHGPSPGRVGIYRICEWKYIVRIRTRRIAGTLVIIRFQCEIKRAIISPQRSDMKSTEHATTQQSPNSSPNGSNSRHTDWPLQQL